MSPSRRLAVALGLGLLAALAASAPAGGDKAPGDAQPSSGGQAEREKWAEHTGDVPFVFGFANGMKEVEFTGRPPMYFFTATW